jgi:hypothetical protein
MQRQQQLIGLTKGRGEVIPKFASSEFHHSVKVFLGSMPPIRFEIARTKLLEAALSIAPA